MQRLNSQRPQACVCVCVCVLCHHYICTCVLQCVVCANKIYNYIIIILFSWVLSIKNTVSLTNTTSSVHKKRHWWWLTSGWLQADFRLTSDFNTRLKQQHMFLLYWSLSTMKNSLWILDMHEKIKRNFVNVWSFRSIQLKVTLGCPTDAQCSISRKCSISRSLYSTTILLRLCVLKSTNIKTHWYLLPIVKLQTSCPIQNRLGNNIHHNQHLSCWRSAPHRLLLV